MPLDANGERPDRAWVPISIPVKRSRRRAHRTAGSSGTASTRPVATSASASASGDPAGPDRCRSLSRNSLADVRFYAWASVNRGRPRRGHGLCPRCRVAVFVHPRGGSDTRRGRSGGYQHPVCVVPPQPGCRETDRDLCRSGSPSPFRMVGPGTHPIIVGTNAGNNVHARDGLIKKVTGRLGPQGMSLQFLRGGWLFSDPCRKDKRPTGHPSRTDRQRLRERPLR